MKRTKKLLALALALVMAFTTLVMPAMAAGEDEGIMPRKPGRECLTCGRTAMYAGHENRYREDESYPVGIGECSKISVPHVHKPYDIMEVYRCDNCGQKYSQKIGESYTCEKNS